LPRRLLLRGRNSCAAGVRRYCARILLWTGRSFLKDSKRLERARRLGSRACLRTLSCIRGDSESQSNHSAMCSRTHSRICFVTLVLSHSCCHRRGPRPWREKSARKAFTAKAAPSTGPHARVSPDLAVPQGAALAMAPFARKGMHVVVAQRMQYSANVPRGSSVRKAKSNSLARPVTLGHFAQVRPCALNPIPRQ
jgi:hypothetical protein